MMATVMASVDVKGLEKSLICATCYVITNARKRAPSVWNDYQTHMRLRN